MVVLAAFFGAVVSSLALVTRDRVEAGERAQFRQHVLSAFHLPAPREPDALARLWSRRVEELAAPQGEYYRVRGEDGALLGYGFRFQGPGFWGPISGVLAVKPGGTEILGIAFTKHQETPGLGGRITEAWFREQFRGKPLAPPPGGGPALTFVYRPPREPREVEAVTGATQTSSRLEESLNRFLEDLRRHSALAGGEAR
jgi:Na+-transporting NADH:ubiquinone oxidoreductase subunit C